MYFRVIRQDRLLEMFGYFLSACIISFIVDRAMAASNARESAMKKNVKMGSVRIDLDDRPNEWVTYTCPYLDCEFKAYGYTTPYAQGAMKSHMALEHQEE